MSVSVRWMIRRDTPEAARMLGWPKNVDAAYAQFEAEWNIKYVQKAVALEGGRVVGVAKYLHGGHFDRIVVQRMAVRSDDLWPEAGGAMLRWLTAKLTPSTDELFVPARTGDMAALSWLDGQGMRMLDRESSRFLGDGAWWFKRTLADVREEVAA